MRDINRRNVPLPYQSGKICNNYVRMRYCDLSYLHGEWYTSKGWNINLRLAVLDSVFSFLFPSVFKGIPLQHFTGWLSWLIYDNVIRHHISVCKLSKLFCEFQGVFRVTVLIGIIKWVESVEIAPYLCLFFFDLLLMLFPLCLIAGKKDRDSSGHCDGQ